MVCTIAEFAMIRQTKGKTQYDTVSCSYTLHNYFTSQMDFVELDDIVVDILKYFIFHSTARLAMLKTLLTKDI